MDFQGDEAVHGLSVRSPPLRLMHVTPIDGGDWGQDFPARVEHAVALGFAGIMLASPFAARGVAGRALVSDFHQLSAAFGGGAASASITAMAAVARRAGIALLLDVELDRLAAGSAAAVSAKGLYEPPADDALLDPRRLADAQAASVTLSEPASVAALAAWWVDHLKSWRTMGVAGFRLTGLAGLSGGTASVLARLRQALPEALLLAWTPGVDADELAGLETIGLDGVFASLPWWDWQSPWLWDELERLERIAPVIGLPSLPGRLPDMDALPGSRPGAAASRCLALAAGLGGGWMVDAALADADADTVGTLNRLLAEAGLPLTGRTLRLLGGSGAPVLSLLRSEGDPRLAGRASLLLINTDTKAARSLDPALLLSAAGGNFGRFTAVATVNDDGLEVIAPDAATSVPPGGFRVFEAVATPRPAASGRITPASALAAGAASRLAIESVTPAVDAGVFPVKRIVGELVSV